jgi:nucleoside-triphosphatase THEP1
LARATPCHLLVVDELGPLEIEREEGLLKAFDVLRRGDFALALVVIRPELVVKAQLRLPVSATTVLTVTPDDRDNLPATFLEMLETRLGSPSEA